MTSVEKVHCVHDYWDMTILNGVADYKTQPCYFSNVAPTEGKDWFSDRYHLTLLSESIFEKFLFNWKFWLQWLKQDVLPHPLRYVEMREHLSAKMIMYQNPLIPADQWLTLEAYYQNEIEIKHYLEKTPYQYEVRGVFIGALDGTDTVVEWSDV